MRRMAGAILGAVVAVAMTGCGGGGSGADTATCSPSGTSLSVAAKGFKFDTDCLAAPAGKAFTITLDNEDPGTAHNVAILSDTGDELFTGDIFTGPKTETYHVGPLQPGTYSFRCDVHKTMEGSFVVA
jgi:plastocyanin